MATPSTVLHIAMYPFFGLGMLTSYLRLANKLAKKGHKISFLCPGPKTQSKLEPFNLHPNLITFVPITIPHLEGLPPSAETTADLPFPLYSFLTKAMDLTEDQIEHSLRELNVDLVFFNFAHWMPAVAHRIGIKSVCYFTSSPANVGYVLTPARQPFDREVTITDLMQPPPGYPDSSIKFHKHEAKVLAGARIMKFGSEMLFYDRLFSSMSNCDALAFRGCPEIEGLYCGYLESQFGTQVLLSGSSIPESPTSPLEEKWVKWLAKFSAGSVIYCAFGSQCILRKDQFQELLLGLELTGMPFLAALKPPIGATSVEAAFPENFEERVEGRGIVHGEWVQQQLILEHPSIGCFITHCGSGSLWEGLVNKCQLVLLPNVGDQIVNARVMSRRLKVGVEVEKGEEDGCITRESTAKAVRIVMEEDSDIGMEVRANHTKLRGLLLEKDLQSSYIDKFVAKLQELIGS